MRPRGGWRTDPGSGMAPQWLRALAVAGAAALGWLVFAGVAAWAWIALTAPAAHAATAHGSNSAAVGALATREDAATQSRRAEYGVTLAMTGQYREAELAFASLLSASPGDARALANLGNLRVVRGELGVALAFYDRALLSGENEAGIILNRATTLMLMGDRERAETEAARGIALAGGEGAAEQLLGLPSVLPDTTARASGKPFMSRQQIRDLLQAASRRVPGRTMKASTPADSIRSDRTRPATRWRNAGARAADGGEIASLLYWKR